VNDTHALSDIEPDAKNLLGIKKMNKLTDKGYTTGIHIAIYKKNNITTYSSPKAHQIHFTKHMFFAFHQSIDESPMPF